MMKLSKTLLFLILLQINSLLSDGSLNNRPMIGILEQEERGSEKGQLKAVAFIASPYVKFLEIAGARVVPIEINKDREYYRDMVNKTNGLLLPGGGRNIMNSYYRDAAEILFDYAMEANDRGEYYPIWGECMGFQIITVLMIKKHAHNPNHTDNWLANCNAEDMAVNLDFKSYPSQTRLFANADKNIINILKTQNVTPNYHHNCMTPKNFTESKLTNYFRIITTSKDADDLEFISTYESLNKSRPIYALQWHPEKIPFEFIVIKGGELPQENIPHNYKAILIAQFMANFFVNETRKNHHHFTNTAEENEYIIYKYNPKFTQEEDKGEHFSQMYYFYFDKDNANQTKLPVKLILIIIITIIVIIGIVILVLFIKYRRCCRKSTYEEVL